jgi:hypothetical protein
MNLSIAAAVSTSQDQSNHHGPSAVLVSGIAAMILVAIVM